jgi:hypothetical protein
MAKKKCKSKSKSKSKSSGGSKRKGSNAIKKIAARAKQLQKSSNKAWKELIKQASAEYRAGKL